jgi:hypothetical protein
MALVLPCVAFLIRKRRFEAPTFWFEEGVEEQKEEEDSKKARKIRGVGCLFVGVSLCVLFY